jgi:hypothetical protein
MDTTPEYVKMCQQATEIQEAWAPDEGDFVLMDNGVNCIGDYILSCGVAVDQGCDCCSMEWTFSAWIPRQDQLQEMIEWTPKRLWVECQILDVPDYVFALPDYAKECKSWEQLWLAFVMNERYGKTWNGEEWVKA